MIEGQQRSSRLAMELPLIGQVTHEATLEKADAIVEGWFDFYGEAHRVGDPVDWEHNPGTKHWAHDLNRFSFLDTLCRGYELTGEDRYLRRGLDLMESWIRQSRTIEPGASKYLWGWWFSSYLNVAIHLSHWLSFLAVVDRHAPHLLEDAALERIKASIGEQIQWLDGIIPAMQMNFIQMGCHGVLMAVAAFPDLPRADEFAARAWERLEEAFQRQILPDGAQDELTPHYQDVVLSHALQALRYAKTRVPPPPSLLERLRAPLHYLRQAVTPDGLLVAFNDGDPDRYQREARRTLDCADALLGPSGHPLESECFPWAGVVFLREGQSVGNTEAYLAFDAGPYGTNHQHEDKLGFWLSAFGRSFIVDPGRHLYDDSSASFLSYLRSTPAHSTILIDGQGQNSAAAKDVPGAWRSVRPQPILFKRGASRHIAGGRYDLGYGPERIPCAHWRIVIFHVKLKLWTLIDHVTGAGEHDVESRFQFAPGELTVEGFRAVTLFPDANLAVEADPACWDEIRVEKGQSDPRRGWFSMGYNQIEPAPALVLASRRRLPFTAITALVPYRGPAPDEKSLHESLSITRHLLPASLNTLKSLVQRHRGAERGNIPC